MLTDLEHKAPRQRWLLPSIAFRLRPIPEHSDEEFNVRDGLSVPYLKRGLGYLIFTIKE